MYTMLECQATRGARATSRLGHLLLWTLNAPTIIAKVTGSSGAEKTAFANFEGIS